jgi:hypothetical protein
MNRIFEALATLDELARPWIAGLQRAAVSHPEYVAGIAAVVVVSVTGIALWVAWQSEPAADSDEQSRTGDERTTALSVQSDSQLGVEVKTIIGTLRFPNWHAVGRLGDYLCHRYYNGSTTADIYRKCKSKRTKVHGLDAVYLRSSSAGRRTVVVIENKVNGSPYRSSQMSDEAILEQCEKMLDTIDEELRETARLIRKAIDGEGGFQIERLLIRYDLVKGRMKRTRLCSAGKAVPLSSKSRDISDTLRVILAIRLAKGEYETV